MPGLTNRPMPPSGASTESRASSTTSRLRVSQAVKETVGKRLSCGLFNPMKHAYASCALGAKATPAIRLPSGLRLPRSPSEQWLRSGILAHFAWPVQYHGSWKPGPMHACLGRSSETGEGHPTENSRVTQRLVSGPILGGLGPSLQGQLGPLTRL